MPILSAETDVFPADLFSRIQPAEDKEARWWAVYTRSRQEKQLVRGLLAMEIHFYCPIVPHRYRSTAGRMRMSYLPLFTNYVFMHCDGYDRYRAMKTNLISKTIEVTNWQEFTHDLRQIQLLIQFGRPLSVETKFQPGSKVRIKSGPLTGIEGVILKREGSEYLYVAVNFLQQGALVKLENYEVEPLI